MAYSLICANIPIELTYIIENFTDQKAINMAKYISKIATSSPKFSKDSEPLIGFNNIECIGNSERRVELFTRKYITELEKKCRKNIGKMHKILKELSAGNNIGGDWDDDIYQVLEAINNNINTYIVTNKKFNSLNKHLISENRPTLQNMVDDRLVNNILIKYCSS